MKVLNISLTNNKYNLVIIFAIFISVLLIVFTMFSVFNDDGSLEVNIYDSEAVTSYTSTYRATIVSNKTINTYSINEMYKLDSDTDCFLFNFYDALNGNVTYITKGDNIKISSENQISTYISNYKRTNNFNLLSTKTYLDILTSLYSDDNNLCYYLDTVVYTEKGGSELTIILDKELHGKVHNDIDSCGIFSLYNEGLKLNKIEMSLDSKGYITGIRVYSNDKLYLELEYDALRINDTLDSNIFNVEV